mmetsp:Transcript_59554/g.98751  ORF Transcript_59554/g.98751 Transcript_59554/m.98751 type:complete len:202 (+) Transcript_59554:645-1250(+)
MLFTLCCPMIDCNRLQRLRVACSVRPGNRRVIASHLWPNSNTPAAMILSSAAVHTLLRTLVCVLKKSAVPLCSVKSSVELDRLEDGETPPLPTASGFTAFVRTALPCLPVQFGQSHSMSAMAERWPLLAASAIVLANLHLALGCPGSVACSLAQRLRTASSDRPGSCAAMVRQRQPSCSTPVRINSSSTALHSLRGNAATA